MKTILIPIAAVLPLSLSAAEKEPTVATMQGNVFRPVKLEATAERMKLLELPEGFKITVFAEGLEAPRMLATAPGGGIYVTRRAPFNDVHLVRDADGDGKAEFREKLITLPDVHGIAIRENTVYLAAIRDLYSAPILADGKFGPITKLCADLPDAGQHPNRTLEFSPAGELFLSVGSTCNAAPEPNLESATMLKVSTDGKKREVFASGLRNTIGFAWHPGSGKLYGMDHGIDWLGDDSQKEEFNEIKEGGKYGWPFVFEDGKANPARDPAETTGLTWKAYAATCVNSIGTHTAHSAPMALLFPSAKAWPAEFEGDGLVTLHGSWNRGTASGYGIVRVKIGKEKATFEPFLTGFFVPGERGQFGRPCDLIEDTDGSLLMSDDSGGKIYRITHGKSK